MDHNQMIRKDLRHSWHPYTQMSTLVADPPLLIERAEGLFLYDADGKKYYDAISSWWCVVHGHGHPRIREAVARQMEKLDHVLFAGATHEPAIRLAQRLAAPAALDGIAQVRAFRPALDDSSHPDHGLARWFAGEDMVRLPLLGPNLLAERLLAGLVAAGPDRTARPADAAALHQRLFGGPPPPGWTASLKLPPNASLRDLCKRAVATDAARAAFGRISASYAW